MTPPLKLNQTVYHFIHGWLEGKVIEIRPEEDFPCRIQDSGFKSYWYAMDGREFPEDVNPTWVADPPKPYESRKGCLCLPKFKG